MPEIYVLNIFFPKKFRTHFTGFTPKKSRFSFLDKDE